MARDRLTGGLAREYQLGPADEATVQGWIDGGMHAAEARNRIRARDRRPAVAARYDAGYSIGQIAEAMGLSVHQVTGDVASLGHTCNGKPLWDYPEAERATFRLISRAVDRRFTAGESIAEIAEAEHRTPAQIAAYLDAAGWAMGHGGPPLSSLPDGELADLRVQAPRAAAREGEQGTCARPGCGEPFTARGHGQKYCTPGCQRAEQIRRAAERRQAR